MRAFFTILIITFSFVSLYSTTWDEPWRKEIIEEATHFILGEVINNTDTAIILNVIKDFDNQIQGQIIIDGYFLLDLCSRSEGHALDFSFEEGKKAYFLMQKGEKGNYKIPTPTSGVDFINEDQVHCTFRHSYHQAALSPEIYELVYRSIWGQYKNGDRIPDNLIEFIDSTLNKKPSGFEEDEIQIFFEQHAALETAFLMGIKLDIDIISKFIEAENDHAQISGIRALGINKSKRARKYLYEYIKNSKSNNFNKVIAIWSLWEHGKRIDKTKLWKLRVDLSDEEKGFGGNLMDHRVCTYFPSPRKAIFDLKG